VRGVNVYNNAYFFRLRDVMAEATPALLHAIGSDVYTQMALGYFAAHPSTSYNVKYLGAHLADYLRGCDESWHGDLDNDVLADLAALEIARFDIFDELDGDAAVGVEALAAVPPEQWSDARFTFRPAMRVLDTTHDVWDLWQAGENGDEQLPLPAREAEALLVYRTDDGVFHERLTAEGRRLIGALAGGATFQAGCTAYCGGEMDGGDDEAVQQAVALLAQWLGCGLISAIVTE
jgi:hypothetical protein